MPSGIPSNMKSPTCSPTEMIGVSDDPCGTSSDNVRYGSLSVWNPSPCFPWESACAGTANPSTNTRDPTTPMIRRLTTSALPA